jgi:hypothetical protein
MERSCASGALVKDSIKKHIEIYYIILLAVSLYTILPAKSSI